MKHEHGNAYNLFILVLTLFSLATMALLLLPVDEPTRELLNVYDNVICVLFLGDFAFSLARSRPRRQYFIYERGWLDLLGSIPNFGLFQLGVLLRLARLSRLARITRLLGGTNRKALVKDVVDNRGQYAAFITVLAAGLVLSVASILMVQFEAGTESANIKTGNDALWWGIVTITTVGYGDRYPVTLLGRTTAFVVMLAGVGIIGALASILASLLVPPPAGDPEPATDSTAVAGGDAGVAAELAALRAEVRSLREALVPAGVGPPGDDRGDDRGDAAPEPVAGA
jgi:voltage-gated potassium channel